MTEKVYTITYGDVAENHAKMQKIGTLHDSGYSIEQLEKVQSIVNELGLKTEMVNLNGEFEAAMVLIIRKGAQFILGEETDGLIEENDALTMDKKALMRGKVVNKVARWNLCFAEEDQEPDYEDGKGRIVSWSRIPRMQRIREAISSWTDDVLLNGEANYYYDLSRCGIGYHGDAERKKVFAVRMGATMPLFFQWFQRSAPIGEPIKLVLNDGDMYMMSEKAVGFDWLKKVIPTLRHSTGCVKFTGLNGVPPQVKKGAKKELEVEAKKVDKKSESDEKKAAKKAESDAKKAAKKEEADEKKAAKKAEADAKKAAKKEEADAKKAAKKEEADAKKEAKKAEADEKKAAKKAEADAKKAAKKAESDAKKEAKKK